MLVDKNENKGLLMMLAAALVFSIMNALVKKALQSIPFMETVFFRGAFGTVFITLLLLHRKIPLIGPNRRLLTLRGLLGFLGLSCYYFTMSRLTIADTVILNKMSPLFVMILAHFFLKEVLNRWHYGVLLLAMAGVFNVIQPQMKFEPFAGVIGLSSAVFSGMAYICVKKLSRNHHSSQIVLAFVFISSLLSLPFILKNFVWPDRDQWIILTSIGFSSALAQLLMTRAYALGSPTPISLAGYSVVIFSGIWGYFLFSEIQDFQALMGSLLVISSLALLPFIRAGSKPSVIPKVPAAEV